MNKSRFSLIEILIVVAIIAILAALLLPTLSKAKYYARDSLCINSQRQEAMALHVYANDFKGFLPSMKPFGGNSEINSPQFTRYTYQQSNDVFMNQGILYGKLYIPGDLLHCEQQNVKLGKNKKTYDFYLVDGAYNLTDAVQASGQAVGRTAYNLYPYEMYLSERRSITLEKIGTDQILISDVLYDTSHSTYTKDWFVTTVDGSVQKYSSDEAYDYAIENNNIYNNWAKYRTIYDMIISD